MGAVQSVRTRAVARPQAGQSVSVALDGISWVDGCFGDYPADVGHSCVDASASCGETCVPVECAQTFA